MALPHRTRTFTVPPDITAFRHVKALGLPVEMIDRPDSPDAGLIYCITRREGRWIPGRLCECGAVRLMWTEGERT